LKVANDSRDAADKAAKDALALAKSEIEKAAKSGTGLIDAASKAAEEAAAKAFAAGQAKTTLDALAARLGPAQKEACERAAAAAKALAQAQTDLTKAQVAKVASDAELQSAIQSAQQAAEALIAARGPYATAEAEQKRIESELAAARKALDDSAKTVRT